MATWRPDMIDEHWERRPDGTAVRVLRETALGGIAWRIWMADTRGVPAPGPSTA